MNNQVNLTDEDKEELELLLKSSPSLKIAHELQEELITLIFYLKVPLDTFNILYTQYLILVC
jgi:hypothetical protein